MQHVISRALVGTKPIAAGIHGKVYAAHLAIKVANVDLQSCLEAEVEATIDIQHPHICKPLFLSRHDDWLAMGMPLAQLGSLASFLRCGSRLPACACTPACLPHVQAFFSECCVINLRLLGCASFLVSPPSNLRSMTQHSETHWKKMLHGGTEQCIQGLQPTGNASSSAM